MSSLGGMRALAAPSSLSLLVAAAPPQPFVPLDWPEYGDCARQTVEDFDWKTAVITDLLVDKAVGFDLDGDGELDNKAGEAALLTSALSQRIMANAGGGVLLILEYRGATDLSAAECFDLNLLRGVGPSHGADIRRGSGVLDVDPRSIGDDGHPFERFPNATILDTEAKGPVVFAETDEWLLSIPVSGPLSLELTIDDAILQAPVAADGAVSGGVVAGTISTATLQSEFENVLDPGIFGGLEFAELVGGPDQDTDGDGRADSYSIGIRFEAVPVTVRGMAEARPPTP